MDASHSTSIEILSLGFAIDFFGQMWVPVTSAVSEGSEVLKSPAMTMCRTGCPGCIPGDDDKEDVG
eukprot:3756824-Heterocapsa_arctica.AAC.1